MPQNTIEVVKALNYLIPSGRYDNLFQKLGFDMKKADRLGEIKRKKQIVNTKVFNTKTKQYNKNDLEAEEERAKRTMRQSLGIMGELEDKYNRDKKYIIISFRRLGEVTRVGIRTLTKCSNYYQTRPLSWLILCMDFYNNIENI